MPTTTSTTTVTGPGGTTTTTSTATTADTLPVPASAAGAAEAPAAKVPLKPPGPAELPEWSAQCQEKPLEPLLPIFDCHHHFFDWSKATAGDAEIPVPDEFRAQFTNLPAFEPSFGVRNAVFESRLSHTEEEWASGAVRSHCYDDAAFLADSKGNNVVGTLFEECISSPLLLLRPASCACCPWGPGAASNVGCYD